MVGGDTQSGSATGRWILIVPDTCQPRADALARLVAKGLQRPSLLADVNRAISCEDVHLCPPNRQPRLIGPLYLEDAALKWRRWGLTPLHFA